MLSSLMLASMLAAAPTPEGTPPVAPPPETITDTTKLPLGLLHDMALPATFDFDGDGKPDRIAFDTTDHGNVTVTITSSRTGETQKLLETKASLIELAATNFGLKVDGDPEQGVTIDFFGLKGETHLIPITLEVKPGTLAVTAEGKHQRFAWNGTAFKAK